MEPRGSLKEWLKDAFLLGTGTPRIMPYTLASPKWPKHYSPLRAVIISDLHVGCPAVTPERLAGIVDRINAIRPDVVLLAGDYTNTDSYNGKFVEPKHIAYILGQIRAKYGTFAVLGNHDNTDARDAMWDALVSRGIEVLENKAVRIRRPRNENVWIAGIADDLTAKPDMKRAFADVSNPNEPVIVIAHNPASFLEHNDRYIAMVSGHIHGKQVRFWGRDWIQKLPTRAPLHYAYGHIQEQGRDLYVTSGLGTSDYPIRLNCPAEIMTVNFRPEWT